MPYGSLQGNSTAKRIAHNVSWFDAEKLHERFDVVGHCLEGQRPVDIGRMPMALQFDGDDFPLLGQRSQVRTEHGDTHNPAMQQDQRFPGTVNFVVELEAVYWSVAGFDGSCRAFLSECQGPCCQD